MTNVDIRWVLVSVSKGSLKKSFIFILIIVQCRGISSAMHGDTKQKDMQFLHKKKMQSTLRISVFKQVTIDLSFIIIVQ